MTQRAARNPVAQGAATVTTGGLFALAAAGLGVPDAWIPYVAVCGAGALNTTGSLLRTYRHEAEADGRQFGPLARTFFITFGMT